MIYLYIFNIFDIFKNVFIVPFSKIVATVPVRREGTALALSRELVDREDTEVVEVTKANRDKLREELVAKLSCSY